jgi:hypothetical protein
MRPLWLDIERLVLDGIELDPARVQRMAGLAQAALERLLRERGISPRLRYATEENADQAAMKGNMQARGDMQAPSNNNEVRWAEDLAEALYRALDRMQ